MHLLASLLLVMQAFDPGGGVSADEVATLPAAHGPSFAAGFEQLHQQIGEAMGTPVEVEHPVEDADSVQRTTTGLAVWRHGEPPSFTDGWRTWRLETQDVQAIADATTPQQTRGPPPGVWDRLAQCESGGNWANTRNPVYSGGLQFDAATWARYGGLNYARTPAQATRAQQIEVAIRTQAVQGWGAWPVCSRRLGLR